MVDLTTEPAYDARHEATVRRDLAARMRRYVGAGLDPVLAEQAAVDLEAIAARLESEVA